MAQDVLLQMTDIVKTFPGVKALNHVSLTVHAGTVHALMGENGAGKSTLMKCLFGMYNRDGGTITLEGREVNFKNSRAHIEKQIYQRGYTIRNVIGVLLWIMKNRFVDIANIG